MSKPTVSFNALDFASGVPGLIVVGTNPYQTPDRLLNTNPVGSANKSVTSSAYFQQKQLQVKVEIGVSDRDTLENSIDLLEQIVQAREAILAVVQNSVSRQYTATMSSVITIDTQGGWAAITITFRCSDPYGYDTGSTSLGSTRFTGSTKNLAFIIAGTAEWQLPVITITLNSLTGGTTKNLVIGNSATGQQITVTRTWTAADVLVIDSYLRKVTVNGNEVAFTGAFPEFNKGSGSLDYSDTLTTRDVTVAAAYTKRYL